MGALFRSEEMSLVQLFIQPEAAYNIVSELGEIGCFQFRDLSEHLTSYNRQFVGEVRRCEEMEKQLRYIESEVKKDDVRILEIDEAPKAPNPREIVELEIYLEKTQKDIKEMSESSVKLKDNYVELTQMKHLLEKAQHFFATPENFEDAKWTAEDIRSGAPLRYVAGVIDQPRFFAFERMLWRIGRGNIYIRHDEISETVVDPRTGIEQRKIAFIAFFQGPHLQSRIDKICHGFHVTMYDCPNVAEERRRRLIKLGVEVADIQKILGQVTDHRRRILANVARELENWSVMVFKMKAIYHTLNLFAVDVSKKCMIGEGWVPKADIHNVQNALTQGAILCGSSVPSFLNLIETKETPPTFNRQNKFTQGFQNLISSYGMATYQELNPALYTTITFPFLFAVMFGDFGHGMIMFLVGLYLVLAEKKLASKRKNEIFEIFFAGRYIMLLMGLFSMYTGLIYNDVFSKSINIFGSKWEVKPEQLPSDFTNYSSDDETTYFTMLPRWNFKGSPYFAGVDPIWQTAENKIIFLNSFKMKLSIIFGVVHMLFGIVLSTINFVYLKKKHALLLDFLPKILFFTLLFGYLMFLTFLKYVLYSGEYDGAIATDPIQNANVDTAHGSSCAPSVLIYFIDMMLLTEPAKTSADCEIYMYDGQAKIQKVMLMIALLCVPTMLLGTPIYEICTRKKKHSVPVNGRSNGHLVTEIELEDIHKPSTSHHDSDHEGEHEEELSEIWVHSAIHTIEFTLSTVSHTASYLRLWALSLAHAQLSEVLWNMVFQKMGLKLFKNYIGAPAIFIVFAAWAFLTLAILVLMEGLSAFLHTLRLHWVEFMTKFYEGLGYEFEPFSFQKILDGERE